MNNWKKELWLASFELKVTAEKRIVSQILFVLFTVFFLISMLDLYIETGLTGFDLIFLIVFAFAGSMTTPKSLQYQMINDNTHVSPYFTLLHSLPINIKSVIRSRFIASFIQAIPVQITVLILIYVLSPEMQSLMTILEYIFFSIFWLCIGLCLGALFPASSVGHHISKAEYYIIIIALLLCLGAGILIFNSYLGGLVYATINLVTSWPLYSVIGVIVITIITLKLAIKYAENKVERMDYFV
ncbi:hypothetical protein [Alkalibacillus haloalkaliphilus]|uniref:hypothetical protein n=1 Tax=Alkalibacillus haloalkaliphilus TaxID=94136 RepID=UPI00293680AC|nr:hypothetical protein [Alkalibacillus haloalkaliphilus]MDV2581494.1 hypothetical protein [Alkalibacillus haloalkaliphilus]